MDPTKPHAGRLGVEALAPPANAGEQPAQWQARVTGHLANEQFGPAGLAPLKDLSKRTFYRQLGELANLSSPLGCANNAYIAAGRYSKPATSAPWRWASQVSTHYAEHLGRRPSD